MAALLALPLLAGAEKAVRPHDREPLTLPMEVLAPMWNSLLR